MGGGPGITCPSGIAPEDGPDSDGRVWNGVWAGKGRLSVELRFVSAGAVACIGFGEWMCVDGASGLDAGRPYICTGPDIFLRY